MTEQDRSKGLGLASKLLAIGSVFLLLALASIGLTLWVTWQLEGGAAAVNEAGRMRMRSYQLALMLTQQDIHAEPVSWPDLQSRLTAFDETLQLLRSGDAARPLFVPWDRDTRERIEAIDADWRQLRDDAERVGKGQAIPVDFLPRVDHFVSRIDAFVSAIEKHLARWTAMLHTFQLAMMALAILSALALLYVGHVVVLDPVARLQAGLRRIQEGEFDTRVHIHSSDEIGALADGFNAMAENLQSLYASLEDKVREKTAGLELRQQRLSALYEVAAMAARADNLETLSQEFAKQIRRIAHADAVAIRWSDEANERYVLLASDCLPQIMAEEEHCLHAGDCHCGDTSSTLRPGAIRVIPILDASRLNQEKGRKGFDHCVRAGYSTLVSVPLGLHQRLLGEVDLFYRGQPDLSAEERALFESLASHLAGAMESLRAAALDREAAVGAERQLLAQELHDSIAQSLAFLKIQMQLLRDAMSDRDEAAVGSTLNELDTGIKESYSDVRELLLHFRVRTDAEDLEPALRETLSKFEHQTGQKGQLNIHGQGLPLPADVQIQVLHIVQEALSNVRKHAQATQVWVDVETAPTWRVVVRDNGRGFDPAAGPPDDTHVGLRIMKERAHRIGAKVQVSSSPGDTRVELVLPVTTTLTTTNG